MHNLLCQPAEFQTLTGSLTKIFNSSNLSTKQVYSLEHTQEKEQPITPSPAAAPMEKETQPVQPAEEVTTEAIVLEAVQTPKIEECQKTPQTPIVSRFLSVLKSVAAAVTRQIMNKTHF